jgi:predicted negative regulator of RcsB-dependent stress response
MGRIIKVLVILVILAFIGLVGYAYLGDLTPVQSEVKMPVVLNAD